MGYLEQFWATCADYLRTFWKFLVTDAPALGVVLTFLTFLVALAALRHQRRKKTQTPDPTDSPRAQRDRAAMLTKTRREWVDEWLERDLYQAARLELQLTERHSAVEPRVRHYTRGPDGPGREFPRGTPIEQVFDGAAGQLLILGEPGTGKSTKLVELARALIERAENDPSHPIPVILNLSTWTKKRAALDEWMRDELVRLYGVSPERAKQWAGKDLLPLLDGLDEVARGERAACVTAINTYRQAHGLQPLAVCCRREEYDALPVQLDLDNAVEVDPLSREDVESYLDAQGFKLQRVRHALDGDPELWTLMDTPLMLTVLFLASAAPADDGTTEPDARRRLYGRYVKAMFERPRMRRFARNKALRWLGWLAAELSNRHRIPFALEDLDESWLPSWPARRAAKWLFGLVGGLVFGLVGGLVFGMVGGLVRWLVLGLVLGLDEALRPAPVSERSTANEGTRRSLRYAIYLASAGLVFSLVLTWGTYALGDRSDTSEPAVGRALLAVAPLIAWFGVFLGLRKGGFFALLHWAVRALLRRLNLAPWAYVSFLDEAKDYLFLRKTGGVYQFFHVTFRDFMAETYGADWLAEPPPPDPATPAADAS